MSCQGGQDAALNSQRHPVDIDNVVPRVKVLNVITKLSVGGAQETALRYCSLLDPDRWDTALVAGPESSPEGDLFEEAERLGIRVHAVPTLRRRLRPLSDLRAVIAMVRLFRREQPDIVHTHSSKAGLLGRMAARVAGVPVVVHTVHGWSFHDGMSSLLRAATVAAERVAARWTSGLVVVAQRDADLGRASRIGDGSTYTLIRSGIDLGAFRSESGSRDAARAALGLPIEVPVMGTVTRLCRQKDPTTLLLAARLVVDARPDARLLLIGDGPLRGEVERLVDSLGLGPHVMMLGPRSDVAALLPAFDVFVLSSRWEGLPRAVLEAMAAGVPVVATEVGGVAEVAEHGVSGLLTPVGDPPALAAAVLRVLSDRLLSARLAAAAETRLHEFDASGMVDRLEALYLELLAGGRSRSRRLRMARTVRNASDHEAA